MLKKFLIALFFVLFNLSAHAAGNDIKCRVKQIERLREVKCQEKYTFPAICLTLECLSKSKFVCKGNGSEFKVKFFYRYRQTKDQHNQYSVKPEFELKRTEFKPATKAVDLPETCN